jgi:O-antigen ligase
MLFFGVALGIGALQSILNDVGVDAVRRVLTTSYSLLLFYFMMVYTLRGRRDLDLLLGSFTVGSLVAVLSGWLGWGVMVESAQFGERLTGEGGNPNLLAFNLLIAIAGTASLYFTATSRLRKVLCLGALAIMPVGVVFTLSRSGVIGLVAMGAFWAARFRRLGFLRYAAPFLVLAVLAVAFMPENAVKRLSTLTPEGIQSEGSAHGRLTMWFGAAAALMHNPITGVGLNGYKAFAWEHDLRGTGIHSAYLEVLAEHGLLGFVPWVAIFVLSWSEFSLAWRSARRPRARGDPELQVLALRAGLLQIGFLGVLVMGLAQPSMRHKGLWLLFALSTGVLALVRERLRALELVPEPEPVGWSAPARTAPTPFSTPLDAKTT